MWHIYDWGLDYYWENTDSQWRELPVTVSNTFSDESANNTKTTFTYGTYDWEA